MRRTVSLGQLRAVVEQVLHRMKYQRPVRRGPKPRYSEALIITLALYMQQEGISIREVLHRAHQEMGEPVPVPSTLVHRLHQLQPEIMERLVEELGLWVVASSSNQSEQHAGAQEDAPSQAHELPEPEALLHAMDGTGFSYDDVLGLK